MPTTIVLPAGSSIIIEHESAGTSRWIRASQHGSINVGPLRTPDVEAPAPDTSIVRVNIGAAEYCYKNPYNATPGDIVRVVLPNFRPYYTRVIGYGKGSYTGNVYKSCERVPSSALGA